MSSYYEASLQRDIDRIRGKLQEMGRLAESALDGALRAFVECDPKRAYAVILRDRRIDELEREIDRLCLEFLVRQQPVARHLRFAYSTIKINLELERVGDYAESIARQAIKLSNMELSLPIEQYEALGKKAIGTLQQAVQAFTSEDEVLARQVMADEEAIDIMRSEINAEILRRCQEGTIPVQAFTPLRTIARRFERASDQAKNISEEAIYVSTGEYSKHANADIWRVVFIDEHNHCRSQMAEAIGESLDQPGFVFSSAGLDPQPIDERTVEFLKRKGIAPSRFASQSVEQVPNLDVAQIIVALDPGARRAFPKPTKAVCIDWSLPDPSKVDADEATKTAAFEAAFNFLHEHISGLTAAVLGDQIS
jgi:phosphate transport system protein